MIWSSVEKSNKLKTRLVDETITVMNELANQTHLENYPYRTLEM